MGFGIRDEKNWHDLLVVPAALYGMEMSIASFHPSDMYPMLRSNDAYRVGPMVSFLNTHAQC